MTSEEKLLSESTMLLTVSFSWRISPWAFTSIVLERSPRATAVVLWIEYKRSESQRNVLMMDTCLERLTRRRSIVLVLSGSTP